MSEERWLNVWRLGFAPQLSTRALKCLARGLRSNDPNLIQGATTSPPPLACIQDWPVEAACAVAYAGWKGEDLQTVAEVEEFFALACAEADRLFDDPGVCKQFLDTYDDTPMSEVKAKLLPELERELNSRAAPAAVESIG